MGSQENMARAMRGSRFKGAPPIALDELKKIPGALRAHRISLEVAHADAARAVRKLRRDLDKGEIGQERFARESRAAWESAQTVVQKRGEKIRELRERASRRLRRGLERAVGARGDGDQERRLRDVPEVAPA